MAMTETSFHFNDDAGLYAFQRGLQKAFPSDCTDVLGNVCFRVSGRALDLAMDVNDHTLIEEQARVKADEEAADVARHCRFGIGPQQRCGYGVLCSMGIER